MTSTTNYGGTLPTVGASSGTWGAENNALHVLWDDKIKLAADAAAAAQAAAAAAGDLISSGSFAAQSAPGVALTGYNAYKVVFHGLIPSGNPTFKLELSFDSGGSWKQGANDYAYNLLSVTNLAGVNRNPTASGFLVTQSAMDSTASKANAITIELYGPRAAGFGATIRTESEYWASANPEFDISRGQIVPGYGAPTNARLVCSTGTVTGETVVRGISGF